MSYLSVLGNYICWGSNRVEHDHINNLFKRFKDGNRRGSTHEYLSASILIEREVVDASFGATRASAGKPRILKEPIRLDCTFYEMKVMTVLFSPFFT